MFYDEQGTPEAWFDGLLEAAGNCDDIGQQYDWYEQLYTTRYALPTDVTIDVTGEPVADQVCQIRADVCMEAGGASKPLDVYVVQVLDHWPGEAAAWSRNGFKQAAETESVVLAPGTCQSVQRTMTCDNESWANRANIKIIVWAQDPGPAPAEVHQTAVMGWPFPEPDIPTVSAWGMVVMTLLVLAGGTVVLRRRHAVQM